jgi:inner membrane protein
MEAVANFYADHPFWVWLGIAAILLATEVSTGTGWLLWPTASAGVVAILALVGVRLGGPLGEVLLFAVLTILSTLLANRFLPKRALSSEDLNDRAKDLPGMVGITVSAFDQGRGRVMVNGSEWTAELVDGEAPEKGARVEVVKILGGATIAVRALAA